MKKSFFLFSVSLLPFLVFSQDSTAVKKWDINGYVSFMSSYIQSDITQSEYMDNQIHNRVNIEWYPGEHFSGSLQLRNRFMMGDQMRADSLDISKKEMEKDALSVNLAQGNMFVLNSMIDRLSLKYSVDKLDVTLGRQRINWGQTFVFNVNDIFNAYSFVDFDYPERPGSDALRIQYYPGYTTTIEAAIKYTNDSTVTAAALGRFNVLGYDVQLLAGLYNSNNWVVGGGWSGNIKGISFSGELSYLRPKKNFKNSQGLFFVSSNLNYTFPNSLMLQAEVFYNQYLHNNTLSFINLMKGSQDIKTLSLSEFTYFGSVAYPISPLINANLSGMYYPDLSGYLIFPSIDLSLSDNMKLSLIAMYFKGDSQIPNAVTYPPVTDTKTGEMFMGFVRMKYAF